MHKVILGVIFLCTNLVGMFNDADTWTVISERLCVPFIEHGSTDDQLARTLRSLTKVVCTKLDAHREQKRTLFNNWMAQLCTDKRPLESSDFPNQEQIAHKLRIKKDGTVSCLWGSSSVMFADKGLGFQKYQTGDSFIIPLSVRIGPSGNTVYALLARPAYNDNCRVPKVQYIDSVNFFLDDMGHICTSDMQIMSGFFDKNLKSVTGLCGQLNCFTDIAQRRLCALALPYNPDENRESVGCVITGNAMGFYHAHQRSMFPFHAYVNVHRQPRLVCNDDTMSIIIDALGSGSRYLDYACKNGGKQLVCTEHYVQLSDSTVLNMAELSVGMSFANLTAYLHNCPTITKEDKDFSESLSPYADNRVVHTFVPSERCSQKFFDTIIEVQRNKDTEHPNKEMRKWDTEKVTDCVSAAILAGGIVEYYVPKLAKRFKEEKMPTSKLSFDAYRSVYYGKKCVFFRGYEGSSMDCMRILHDWAKQIEPNVHFEETLDYLYAHAPTVFALHTKLLVTSLKRKAQEYACRSWDNGLLGATWSFDFENMNITLFDFKAPKDKKRVDTYKIPKNVLIYGDSSNVTDVTYAPSQKPTFWIDDRPFCV